MEEGADDVRSSAEAAQGEADALFEDLQIRWALLGRAEAMYSTYRAVLDLDSTEIPVHGEQAWAD